MSNLNDLFLILKGSRYSGNFGHAGRPGKGVGGSSSGGGHAKIGATGSDKLKKLDEYRKVKQPPSIKNKPENKVQSIPERFKDLRQYSNIDVKDANVSMDVQFNLLELEKVPSNVLKALENKGVKIFIGKGALPDLDDMSFAKNQQPRGWPEGKTWNDVAGGYDESSKKVLAGTKSGHIVILHETGHAFQNVVNQHSNKQLVKLHKELLPKLPSYLQQKGVAGQEEFFAELFSKTISNKTEATSEYGKKAVSYMEDLINNA